MTDIDLSALLRRLLIVLVGRWTTLVFQGSLVGSVILFLRHFFEPYLVRNFESFISLELSEWLYFAVGTALVVFIKLIFRSPILRDNNREQFEALEIITSKLSDVERRQVYRSLARKMVEEFKVDSEMELDLQSEAVDAVKSSQ